MGILDTPFILTTPAKVRSFSVLPEVYNFENDAKLQQYIDRAEFIASRLYDYDTTLPYYAAQMEFAIDMLVENLMVMDTPSFKRSNISRLRAEQIGTYSYSRSDPASKGGGDAPHYFTEEILMILKAFVIGNPYQYQTTLVFQPRTFSIDDSGVKYYLPENMVMDQSFRDPPTPERLQGFDGEDI